VLDLMSIRHVSATPILVILAVAVVAGQFTPAPSLARNHPAIGYATAPVTDPIARLDARLRAGGTLAFDAETGYLPALLAALDVRVESQVLVFSKTSFQAAKIGPQNPRALYFNDSVAVGWVRGGEVLELLGQDPRQGAIFYTLDQTRGRPPSITRADGKCLACHVSEATMNVPGAFVGSVFPSPNGTTRYGPAYTTDHRSPLEIRWGGWYVNGSHRAARHMGNAVAERADDLGAMVTEASVHVRSLEGRFDPASYLSRDSDIAALLVLEHQSHMANLITSAGWNGRLGADAVRPLDGLIADLVDYLLFVDEQPLPGPIAGPTAFARRFSAQGPFDSKGRSLRALDLRTRLLRVPCSYMIDSEAFDALPPDVRQAIYARMWEILSGADRDDRYARLTPDDRTAIIEILRETKTDLPSVWATPAG
jgi:hypothetical protein